MLQMKLTAGGMILGFSLSAITGCGPAGGPHAEYDLVDYLFPEQSGTLVYRRYVSQKPEGSNAFSEPKYLQDSHQKVRRNGPVITVMVDGESNRTYSVSDSSIAVEECNATLHYHLKRKVAAHDNFVKESVIMETKESGNTSRITYACEMTDVAPSMKIESNPKTYEHIVHIRCVQDRKVSVKINGTQIATVTERVEENDYAKGVGLIRSERTWCDKVVIDNGHQTDAGCTRTLDRIVTFVAE